MAIIAVSMCALFGFLEVAERMDAETQKGSVWAGGKQPTLLLFVGCVCKHCRLPLAQSELAAKKYCFNRSSGAESRMDKLTDPGASERMAEAKFVESREKKRKTATAT